MLSRQKKERAKRRARYLEVRDDVLESAYKKKLMKQVNKNILYEKFGGIYMAGGAQQATQAIAWVDFWAYIYF